MSVLIFFFYCQIIVYVVDYNLELIPPQPQPFSNPIDWMYHPVHFCSWLPIIILF